MIPKTVNQPVLMYASSRGTAITAECYNRCRSSTDCAGFIVDYERASCFRIPDSKTTSLDDMVPAKNSNFFLKVCLQVPSNCTQKAWPIEYTPNMELVGYQQNVIPNVADKWQCAQLCLTGTTQFRYGQSTPCYSAQYQSWSKTCTISSENRRTKPEAFGPSLHHGADYIENQCIAEPNEGVCWHEPVHNVTLTAIDLQIPNINLEQCREKCIKEPYFNCRGYTYRCAGIGHYSEPTCYLHSDDTLTAGAPVPAVCTVYVERLTCIDLKVDCNANTMTIGLNYKGFNGRIFALDHSEDCGVNGHNEDATTFTLPIPADARAVNRCGIFVAHSVGYGNRKMASVVIVVQRHPIIQTLGDRIIKVTCVAEDATERVGRPLFNNITLDATFGVAEPDIQSSITSEGFGNVSSISPTARLRIVDLSQGGSEAAETTLGEELELRVEIFPPFNVSVLRAGHLVASSGDGRESLLLLDWRGCPPDATTFPAITPKDDHTLSAIFKAFRFPSSPILRFSLILTICDAICQPTDCGNGLSSWGRRKRETNVDDERGETIKQEVPLQLTIIVRSPEHNETNKTEPMMSRQSEEGVRDVICASWPVILTSVLILGLLHILLLAGCCFILQSHHQKLSDQISLQTDFQPRHVTWADQ